MSDYQPHQYVSMELEIIPVTSDQFELYLSLQFTPQWQPVGTGRLQLSLQGGNLRLKFDNAQIVKIISQPQPGWELILSESPVDLVWLVKSLPSSPSKSLLATFTTTTADYQTRATFTPTPAGISFKAIEGLWRHDLSPNKHALLDRKLALCLYKQILFDQIYAVNKTNPAQAFNLPKVTPEILTQLKDVINLVYNAQTDNFTELMAMVALNPLVDLAGGNFLATNMNGIQLNSANLSQTNWRGADLTDADLSETDLSYANFAGADLSGAYFGNANLQHANLHRASLALANLIGANLSYANLSETNLTQTNFSGASLDGAIFQHNLGLSSELKQYLQKKGFIV